MILHFLRVKNFCGIDEKELHPQIKGVTLIEGPNEAGKSSFMRALHILLNIPSDSMKKEIKNVKPVDKDVGPEVEAEIEMGKYHFKISKKYLKNKSTVLEIIRPSRENLTGAEAHSRLQVMMAETMDVQLWNALGAISENQAGEIHKSLSLSRAMSKAAGMVSVEKEELDIFEAIENEKEKYYGSRGEKDLLKNKRKNLSEAAEYLRNLEEELQRSEEDLQNYDIYVGKLNRLRSQKIDLTRKKEGLDLEYKTAKDMEAALSENKLKTESVKTELDSLYSEKKERETIQSEIVSLNEYLARCEEIDGKEQEKNKRSALESLKESSKTFEMQEREKMQLYQTRRGDKEYYNDGMWLQQLIERKDRITIAEQSVKDASDLPHLEDISFSELDSIWKSVERARIEMESESPQIVIKSLSDASIIINNEKREMSAGSKIDQKVSKEMSLITQDFSIIVSPGHDKSREKYITSEKQLDRLYEKYKITSYEEAFELNQRFKKLEDLKSALEKERKTNLRDLTKDELIEKIEELEEKTTSYLSQRENLEMPKNAEEAESLFKTAEEEYNTARNANEEMKKNLKESEEDYERIRKKHEEDTLEITITKTQISAHEGELGRRVSKKSDETLMADIDSKENNLRSLAEEKIILEERSSGHDIDLLFEVVNGTAEAIEVNGKNVSEAEGTLERLKGRLELYGANEIYEKVESARNKKSFMESEFRSIERHAEAAKYLFDIMAEEKQKAQNAYSLPLKNKIEQLGKSLLGGSFEVSLSEELTILSRTTNGKTIDYEMLSTGAKEQIDLIQKLACALLVSEDEGVPLILDDILGHTDPDRMTKMNAVLRMVSNNLQVIILTCNPESYAEIGNVRSFDFGV